MPVEVPRETCLRVEEVVLLVNIEFLVIVAALIVVELIVDTIGLVVDMTVLEISKHIPLLIDMVGSLHKHIAVELMRIAVVVLIVAVQEILPADHRIGSVGHVAEVVAVKVLQRQSADDIPRLILVVCVPHESIGMLRQTLLAHKVRPLDLIAIGIGSCHAKL